LEADSANLLLAARLRLVPSGVSGNFDEPYAAS
jgi:hypothetical protein